MAKDNQSREQAGGIFNRLAAFGSRIAEFVRSLRPPDPPEDARFVDRNASVVVWGWFNLRFATGTTVWVTDDELWVPGPENSSYAIRLADIRAVREKQWYMRRAPVIEIEHGDDRQKIQLAVRDTQTLKAILTSAARPTI